MKKAPIQKITAKAGAKAGGKATSKAAAKTAVKTTPAAGIIYSIAAADLAGHMFKVTLTVKSPAAIGQVLSLPAWIPGSYMIREFSRNIVSIRAESEGKA
ncbi:MAG: hypothetical protein RSF79_15220, partial [Janthinobacterium sp.]